MDGNSSGLAARKAVLEEAGHKTRCVSSPSDALDQFASQKFDLVVTDHQPPRIDGIELIRKIRAREGYTPVVLLSGLVEALGLDEKITGADAVIQKSANEVTHLLRAVSRLLRRRKPPARAALKAKRTAV